MSNRSTHILGSAATEDLTQGYQPIVPDLPSVSGKDLSLIPAARETRDEFSFVRRTGFSVSLNQRDAAGNAAAHHSLVVAATTPLPSYPEHIYHSGFVGRRIRVDKTAQRSVAGARC